MYIYIKRIFKTITNLWCLRKIAKLLVSSKILLYKLFKWLLASVAIYSKEDKDGRKKPSTSQDFDLLMGWDGFRLFFLGLGLKMISDFRSR